MRKRKLYSAIMVSMVSVLIISVLMMTAAGIISNTLFSKELRYNEASSKCESIFSFAEEQIGKAVALSDVCRADDALAQSIFSSDEAAIRRSLSKYRAVFSDRYSDVYVSTLSDSMCDVYGISNTINVYGLVNVLGYNSGNAMMFTNEFTGDKTRAVLYAPKHSNTTENNIVIINKKVFARGPVYYINVVHLDRIISDKMEKSGAYVLNSGASQVLTSDTATQPIRSYIEKYLASNSEFYGEEHDGCVYISKKSEYISECTYVFALSEKSVSASSSNQIALFIISAALAAIAAIVAAFIIRKRIYAPIDRAIDSLAKYNRDYKADEGKYIEESMEKLNRITENANENVRKMKENIKTERLRNLMRRIKDRDHPYTAALDGPYRVSVIEYAKFSHIESAFSSDMLSDIAEQVLECLDGETSGFREGKAVMLDYKSFAVVTAGMDVRLLRGKLMNVVGTVSGSFEIEMYGAIGDLCEDMEDIFASYESALKYMENACSIADKGAIVTAEDMPGGESGLYYPIELEREIITEVIRGNSEEVSVLLDKLLDENIEGDSFTKEKQRTFATAVAATVNRVVSAINATLSDVYGEDFVVFLEIKMCTEKAEIRAKLHSLFDTLTDYVLKQSDPAERDISKQLIDYIHDHYREDISLSDIGNHFNLSQTYVSTLFKEETGDNFKDYLSRCRIRAAKEILKKDPQIKNEKLASLIGVNTVATLLRMFNKYEGMTPAQYVKSQL